MKIIVTTCLFSLVCVYLHTVHAQLSEEIEKEKKKEPLCKKYGITNVMCSGKADDSYEMPGEQHMYMQCSGGNVYCMECWPSTLVYSKRCNQCLYDINDNCRTTQVWTPRPEITCPDVCMSRGPDFSGNLADPNNKYQYVACWKSVKVGCMRCPDDYKGEMTVEFNEEENACLYNGKFMTMPMDTTGNK